MVGVPLDTHGMCPLPRKPRDQRQLAGSSLWWFQGLHPEKPQPGPWGLGVGRVDGGGGGCLWAVTVAGTGG